MQFQPPPLSWERGTGGGEAIKNLINGWFLHKSVHPVSFGIASILKKPVVIENEIRIREILNMTILVDHDVIDGAPMVRLLNDLTKSIESGEINK
ncbi:MAG TPA: 2-oxo acid dehydrogenase subunit E2 [Anaerovoracaceae bacterium]|nr:2-oxo acid dehydrogenase subunit E2 [Anaerovoracaceae bacterium]